MVFTKGVTAPRKAWTGSAQIRSESVYGKYLRGANQWDQDHEDRVSDGAVECLKQHGIQEAVVWLVAHFVHRRRDSMLLHHKMSVSSLLKFFSTATDPIMHHRLQKVVDQELQ
jgi:hypothetical protein